MRPALPNGTGRGKPDDMGNRILIIDDEDDIREVAQVALELVGGWTVLGARSGAEGLAMALEAKADAILLDVMMPDMDGTATFRQLQAYSETEHIPVLLLTAKVQPADQEQFAQLGVVGVIPKPFDPMTLHDQVSKLLGRSG